MGRTWRDASRAAQATFDDADRILANELPGRRPLSELCFEGPADILNRTDVSQPALFTAGVACYRALSERAEPPVVVAAAGLSLGEYTALHITGAVSFEDGLRLVAARGRLMQEAAESSKGSMVALIGADESQAQAVCDKAAEGEVLVCANFNAPGQIVLSGHVGACQRALEAASALGCRATPLQVAGAFHSPLMAPAAEGLAKALAGVAIHASTAPVWSNVTGKAHDSTAEPQGASTLRKLLVEQLVSPVRWAQSCADLIATLSSAAPPGAGTSPDATSPDGPKYLEMAPGSVLKGLMRRIDRSCEVLTHDQAT